MAKQRSEAKALDGSGDLVCRIITPEKTVFVRRIESARLATAGGELEVFSQYEPTIAPLRVGIMTTRDADGAESSIAVHGGFMDMNGNNLVILADSAELGDEVDVARARNSLIRAREMLAQLTDDDASKVKVDADRAKLAIMRALVRLKVAGEEAPPGQA